MNRYEIMKYTQRLVIVALLIGHPILSIGTDIDCNFSQDELRNNPLLDLGYASWKWWPKEAIPDEQWDVDFCYMWAYRKSRDFYSIVANPFTGQQGNQKLDDIRSSQDYLPSLGWELVYRDFGYSDLNDPEAFEGSIFGPRFILYNKIRGVLRVFINVSPGGGETEVNGVTMMMEYENGPGSSSNKPAFAFQNAFQYAPSLKAIRNGDYDDEIGRNSITIGDLPDNGWIAGDFHIGLDPDLGNTSLGTNRSYHDLRLNIRIYASKTALLELNIDGRSCTFDPDNGDLCDLEDESFSYSVRNNPLEGVSSIAKGSASVVKSFEQLTSHVEKNSLKTLVDIEEKVSGKIGRSVIESSSTLKVFGEMSKGKEKLVNALKGIGDVLPYVNTALSALDAISGFFTETPPEIKYSRYSFSASGTINTDFSGPDIEFIIPGATYSNVDFNNNKIPYYSCSMGSCILEETPRFKRLIYDRKLDDEEGYNASDDRQEYMSIKVDNDLNLLYSSLIGAKPVSIQCAIVAKVRNKDLVDWNTRYSSKSFLIAPDRREYRFNLMQHEIEKGVMDIVDLIEDYEFTGPEGDLSVDDALILSSRYFDIKDFRGAAINVPYRYTEISVSVVALFENNYYYKNSYAVEFDPSGLNPEDYTASIFTMPPYAEYDDILGFLYSDFLDSPTEQLIYDNSVTNKASRLDMTLSLPSNSSVFARAGRTITLKPGFHVKGHDDLEFRASIVGHPVSKPQGFGSSEEVFVTGNCYDQNASMARYNESSSTETQRNERFILYPNPSQDHATLKYLIDEERVLHIVLQDMQGREIMRESGSFGINTKKKTIDLSNYTPGIYFLKINANGFEETKKLIIE